MILDSSAIIAVLNQEDEASSFTRTIQAAQRVGVSSATVLEASMVAGRSRRDDVDAFLDSARAEILSVDAAHLEVARDAWARFGRGSGSPARLNFGDCFAYAAAKVTGEPLLFKGDDFTHTDIEGALWPEPC